MARPFSAEQDAWLRMHHAPDKIIRQLAEEYNLFWNENRSADTLKHHCKRLGLKQVYGRPFTDKQDAWLCENSRTMSYKETTKRFNEIFSESRSELSIKVHCNRDLRVFFANKKFSTGLPIGSEKIINGYIWVKVSDDVYSKDSFYRNWRQKAQIVWEQHYGSPPPEGYTIVFLDRNTQNCNIENLYAVSGKVLREMSKKSWWRENADFTLAAIKWCELHYAIKEVDSND